jgi:ABC-type uncharacterized transport system auxiliary subunit
MSASSTFTHRTRDTALLLLVAGILFGCGAPRPVKYYALDTEPAPVNPSGAQFPITILVARVASSHLYRDDRLVYESDAVQLGTYEYQRWAATPVDMLQDVMISSLRATGQYRSVSAIGSNVRGDYILRSRLDALNEVDKPQLAGHFSIELELYDPREGVTMWTDSYTHDEPVAGKNVPDVVVALDKDVRVGMQQLTRSLGQYFTTHPPQPGVNR